MSWNKPFKEAYKSRYNQWMISGDKSYTAHGNVHAPDKALCLQWVIESWECITADIVKKSFLSCGISVEVNGSEDDQIHCLKQGGVASSARPLINSATTRMESRSEEEDLFASLEEDMDELEVNEIVIEDR